MKKSEEEHSNRRIDDTQRTEDEVLDSHQTTAAVPCFISEQDWIAMVVVYIHSIL